VAVGLLLGAFFAGAGLFALAGAGTGLARLLVYPSLGAAGLPHVQATVERVSRSYVGPGYRSPGHCGLLIHLDQPPHRVGYDCDMPRADAVERALAAPGTVAEVWYEPTLPIPDAAPELWQLRVDGQMVLSHAQVAVARQHKLLLGVILHLLFVGLALLFGAIALGCFLNVFKPKHD
jgi:hypothetical protein